MKLLITGANGFLGSYLVNEAVRRGHSVRALVRPTTDQSKLGWDERVEIVRADLRSPACLTDAVRGVDCVIHAAAAKAGDVYTQYAGTVVATENLLRAMTEAGVRKIVAISSFSVYDFTRASPLAPFDEQAPLEKDALQRDGYAHTKLVQERLIRDHALAQNWDYVVIRPGVIWGKDNLLNAWFGMPAGGRFWIRTGSWARVPLTYVENCAEAILLAAESPKAQGQVFNIVDDALPTQREFTRLVLPRYSPRRFTIPVPYTLLRLIAGTASLVNKVLLGGRARVPSLFVPCRLHARGKPLVYSNRKIKETLGWRPRYSLSEALDRSIEPAISPLAAHEPASLRSSAAHHTAAT
jgi:nucleoside-diphosphate-sugar epimerase